MVYLKVYEKDSKDAADKVYSSFIQAGIYLDRMTLSNLVENAKAIRNYLNETYAYFMTFCRWWEDEVEKRKTKDKQVLAAINSFRKTGEQILLLQKKVLDTISELKKKSMEIPGERKRIEDEKNFQAAKKLLKQQYNKLDDVLEENHLLEQYQEVGKELFQPELQLPDLRKFLASIQSKIGKSYQEVKKQELLAEIQLYLQELNKLSKAVSQEFDDILVNILGEIGIWKNVLRNLKDLNPKNYDQMAAQLLVLLHDDDKIYKEIEAA
ncbi:MAG: hypothetical protein Q8R47_03470 [Nanoarchaeota archaeon]|nr:hypothetical protein [Nanoarchaeota archaeon]